MSTIADIVDPGPLTYAGIVVAASRIGGAPPRAVTRFLPEEFLRSDLSTVIDGFAEKLSRFGTVVLAHPELELLEAFGRVRYEGTVVTVVPSTIPDALLVVMRENAPIRCEFVRPSVTSLARIRPLRATIVCVGAHAGSEMQIVPSWTRELLSALPRNWYGDVTLLDPLGRSTTDLPAGWDLIDGGRTFTGSIAAASTPDN